MNKDQHEVDSFINQFQKSYDPSKVAKNVKFGLAVPFPFLYKFEELKKSGLLVGAQNLNEYDNGAFTGEVSAKMLKSYGISFVLIGHSERREHFYEDDYLINRKAQQAIENGLVPVICIGESFQQHKRGISRQVIEKQIKVGLKGLDYEKIIVAYEPIWAIGTGITATEAEAQEMCQFIKELTSDKLIVQYGGSVNPQNISSYLAQTDINGVLVGGASLSVEDFLKLITAQ